MEIEVAEPRAEVAWARALRTATATILLGAATVGALHRFAGIDAGALVLAAAGAAIAVGACLPAARPAWLRPHDS